MIDSYNRLINYARISVTDLCNFRCKYCMPFGVVKKSHQDILSLEDIEQISTVLAELGVHKQRLTGGEPLVRKNILSLIGKLGANPLIKELCITTNGSLLEDMATSLYETNISSLNISLDTLKPDIFRQISCMGDINTVIRGIELARTLGFPSLKLNSVLLKGINDSDIKYMADYAHELGAPIRFIELMPFSAGQRYAQDFFISSKDIINRYNLTPVASSGYEKTRYYAFEDGVKVGFISPISDKFCNYCNRIRITSDGKLLNCLHESREYDLVPYLHDKANLADFITDTVRQKPKEHRLHEGILQSREMDNIGG